MNEASPTVVIAISVSFIPFFRRHKPIDEHWTMINYDVFLLLSTLCAYGYRSRSLVSAGKDLFSIFPIATEQWTGTHFITTCTATAESSPHHSQCRVCRRCHFRRGPAYICVQNAKHPFCKQTSITTTTMSRSICERHHRCVTRCIVCTPVIVTRPANWRTGVQHTCAYPQKREKKMCSQFSVRPNFGG